ncbi:MAG TPA: GNAT family N-acetyltransferase [Clostridia bacterium]|nr:GNAT family N-acetyltransferase [Clostridia bacterium]
MRIVEYQDKYKSDLIFMVLEAKNALGAVPGLNEDLLDVQANYFDKGDMFWLAIDENDRVIGSVGYSSVEGSDEVWLHRLFVKYNLKRKGIGGALLQMAESNIKSKGKTAIRIHLGEQKYYFESYSFYLKHNYKQYDERYMIKNL